MNKCNISIIFEALLVNLMFLELSESYTDK